MPRASLLEGRRWCDLRVAKGAEATVSRARAPTCQRSELALTSNSPRTSTMPAVVQKAAPDFTADAVMPDGSFKTIKLSDYKGASRWDGSA